MYWAVTDPAGDTLVGFVCAGAAAQVPGLDAGSSFIDVGVGMNPGLVGQGEVQNSARQCWTTWRVAEANHTTDPSCFWETQRPNAADQRRRIMGAEHHRRPHLRGHRGCRRHLLSPTRYHLPGVQAHSLGVNPDPGVVPWLDVDSGPIHTGYGDLTIPEFLQATSAAGILVKPSSSGHLTQGRAPKINLY
jgi:hypothetical protein